MVFMMRRPIFEFPDSGLFQQSNCFENAKSLKSNAVTCRDPDRGKRDIALRHLASSGPKPRVFGALSKLLLLATLNPTPLPRVALYIGGDPSWQSYASR